MCKLKSKSPKRSIYSQSGFSVVEAAIVVMVVGIVLAFAIPGIASAVRQYRLNAGVRQVSDLIQRVRMQAISDSRRASFVADEAGRRIGIITYNPDGTVNAQQYLPLPEGIMFERPQGVTAPAPGAPTTSNVSFPARAGSTTEFQQDFNSRGFPIVAVAGAVNVVYLGNGTSHRAITLNSVGALSTWRWETSSWVSTKITG